VVVSVWAWSLFVWSSAYSGEKTGYRLLWSATLLYNWPYQPGFAAHHDTRSLNHLRTGQRCVMQICTDRALPVAWSAIRKCGQQQTLRHTVDTCPLAKKTTVDKDAFNWLGTPATAALAKWKLPGYVASHPTSLLASSRLNVTRGTVVYTMNGAEREATIPCCQAFRQNTFLHSEP